MTDQNLECPICGSEDVIVRLDTRETTLFGLEKVLLKNLRVQVCSECHEEVFFIPNHEPVMREVRARLCALKRPLTGHEFAFLRDGLRLSGQDAAKVLNVHAVSVSRWENGAQPVHGLADNFIRALTLESLGTRNVTTFLLTKEERGVDCVEIDLANYEGTCYRYQAPFQFSKGQENVWVLENASLH